MILENALAIAEEIVVNLKPYCTIINIAGSCRRRKPEVKDIEIVAIPKTVLAPDSPISLFPELTSDRVVSPDYKEAVNRLGVISSGQPEGRYCKIELQQGINLDLFTPVETDYYRIYAMRTGSAQYSAKVIATGWKKIGWCGSNKGLRKKIDCRYNKSSKTWKCVNKKAELPPAWKSEE